MEVWFSIGKNRGREANTREEESQGIYTGAPPERMRRAFCLLTKTYNGSRITGHSVFVKSKFRSTALVRTRSTSRDYALEHLGDDVNMGAAW